MFVRLEPGHPQGDAPPIHELAPHNITIIWEGHPLAGALDPSFTQVEEGFSYES